MSIGAFLVASRPAVAWLHFHGSQGGSTGKSVLNAPVNFSETVFANLVKSSYSLQYGTASPASLNNDLYPVDTASLPDFIQWNFHLPSTQFGSLIQYVMAWTGTGAVTLNLNINVLSVSGTGASVSLGAAPTGIDAVGTNARIVFTITAYPTSGGPGTVGIAYRANRVFSGMSNLRFCRVSDEAAVNADQNAFLPEFLTLVRNLNPKIYRLMDWSMNATDILLSKYIYRSPTTCMGFFLPRFPLLVGTTAGTGDAYTCSPSTDMPGTTWTGGMTFQVIFDRSNSTSTPTIQPTGFSAKTMLRQDTEALTAGSLGSGLYSTCIYDDVLDVVLVWNRVQALNLVGNGGMVTRPPVEVKVALCNALNKDYWNNFPYLYTDASVTAETAYIAANLNPQLDGYFELSNEMWNSNLSNTTGLATARGTAFGLISGNAEHEYGGVAYRLRQVMSLVTTAWGGRRGLNRVFAWLTIDGKLGSSMDRFLLQAGHLATVANGGAIPDSGASNAAWARATGSANTSYITAGQRPIDFIDAFSYAPYYNGAQTVDLDARYSQAGGANIADLVAQADNYAGLGPGTPTDALNWMDNDVRRGTFPVKTVSSVSGTTINSTAHGFSDGQAVNFFVSGGSLPSPLATNRAYHVVGASTNSFSVAIAQGGAAISLSGGSGTWTVGLGGSTSVDGRATTLLAYDVGYYDGAGIYATWQELAVNYSKPVICYEGALSIWYPSTDVCTGSGIWVGKGLGISAAYGGPGGKIDNLIVGYKNDARAATLALNAFQQMMGQDPTSPNFGLLTESKYPAWFTLADEGQWALLPGDTFSTPFQTFTGVRTYNNS